jgi:fermentation-respiration switch protein FrsA (DUF1100 family)
MSFRLIALLGALVALLVPAAAGAAVTPFNSLTCAEPEVGGPRFCGSPPVAAGQPSQTRTRVFTFDSVPLDANVALPPAAAGDGPFPLIVISHGWGGQKKGYTQDEGAGYFGSLKEWATKGYAVLSFTARGFNGSCGNPAERLIIGANCANGFIRLDDYRFEAMDIAYLSGRLVDQGIAKPAIGVAGSSYGGGVSLELAVLKNRICDDLGTGQTGDATKHPCKNLVPWTSPEKGIPMSIAAAAPIIPWSDLVYSLVPNGRTLDYTITNPYVSTTKRGDNASEPGIEKQSFVAGLYATGQQTGYYQPTPAQDSTDTKADLNTWFARLNAGEPYDDDTIAEMTDLIARFRSPYNMPLPADGPAPLFVSNGWTDDLFPADEALRFYNRVRSLFPAAPISLLFADHGHMRGTNSAGDLAIIRERVQALFDHYLKDPANTAAAPANRVEGYLTSCPKIAPKAGPAFSAASWAALHPGEIRFAAKTAAELPPEGDPRESRVSDPIGGGGDACGAVPDATDTPGSATYRLPKVTGSGYTLLGSPTVVANFAVQSGTASQVAARLWDVAPDGSEILVAKTVYRPVGKGTEVFQLHANGWKFAKDHTPRLQLLTSDAPYARKSNSPAQVTASNLQLRLPVAEASDCKIVLAPATPVLPEAATGLSRTLAPGITAGDADSCSSAAVTSAGTGTLGGAPLDRGGNVVGSGGPGGSGGSGITSSMKVRIRFGTPRHRGLVNVRRKGITVRVTCSAACRTTGVARFAGKRVGAGTKRAAKKGTVKLKVRLSAKGVRRVKRVRIARLRLTVVVRDAAGDKAAQRTGRYFVRTRKK